MSIFVVTGKLGGGKTLAAVSQINTALSEGRRVATNLDLDLVHLPALTRKTKLARVLRVPDRPSMHDIQNIGFGIEGVNSLAQARKAYDESRFGILVLDECGTWLNSRDWQAEGRRELINFLLHIRKHLWDVYLIIQDISMLDKQARKALAEHVVYCRRMDRMNVPLLGTLSKWILGKPLKLPKLHIGHVKYGDQPQSLTVDKWWYKGVDLYKAYDTTQVFLDDYPHGIFSMLPPWYQYRGAFVDWNWRKCMQLTKIYLRQYSKTILLAAGIFAGTAIAHAFNDAPGSAQQEPGAPVVAEISEEGVHLVEGTDVDQAARVPLLHRLRIQSLYDDGRRARRVVFTDGVNSFSERAVEAIGIRVAMVGKCRYRLQQGDDYAIIGCFD